MSREEKQGPFEFSGGALCLDLVNTLSDRPEGGVEGLREFADWLRWCEQAGLIDAGEIGGLRRDAVRRPRAASAALRRVRALRETIHSVFSSLAVGRAPAATDLHSLNQMLTRVLPHLRVAPEGEGFVWAWSDPGPGFDHLVWPVVRSAAELLTSGDLPRLRECAADTCGWLFLDRSRAGRRRWCDMKTCGNRAKARRFYRRSKQRSRKAGLST